MDTKKCPKCGVEIPVEMQFCLHCMERTDGVLEIKQKAVLSRKYIIAAIILFCIMAAIIVFLLIGQLTGSGNRKQENSADASVTVSDNDTTENEDEPVGDDTSFTAEEEIQKSQPEVDNNSEEQNQISSDEPQSNPVSPTEEQATVQDNTQSENTQQTENNTHANNTIKPPVTTTAKPQQTTVKTTVVTQAPTQAQTQAPSEAPTVAPILTFEEFVTAQLARWGGSRILSDTLVFSGNSCTFTSNVGTNKVNCTLSSNADRTAYTLYIEPATAYTSYSTSTHLPDIINEMTFLVFDYQMSSNVRYDIAVMFENFQTSGNFSESGYTWEIISAANNNGSKPVTVNASKG